MTKEEDYNKRMIENAKQIKQYMREQLEELKEMLEQDTRTKPETMERAEDMLRAAGDRIDPRSDDEKPINETGFFTELLGLPIIARVPFIPGGYRYAQEADGRVEPVPYESPLEASDLVLDVLDADVVVRMAPQPQDRLDVELHLENCRTCAELNGRWKLCAHCLESKVCSEVPVQRTTRPAQWPPDREGPAFAHLSLCRDCKRDFKNERGLVLEE